MRRSMGAIATASSAASRGSHADDDGATPPPPHERPRRRRRDVVRPQSGRPRVGRPRAERPTATGSMAPVPMSDTRPRDHTIGVVVPVYRGETTLPALLEELDKLAASALTPRGHRFRVSEVVLVHDAGPDRSDLAIRALAERYPYVRPVWLARNFGQHAATLAGMASTSADWIVTM